MNGLKRYLRRLAIKLNSYDLRMEVPEFYFDRRQHVTNLFTNSNTTNIGWLTLQNIRSWANLSERNLFSRHFKRATIGEFFSNAERNHALEYIQYIRRLYGN